MDLYSSMQLAAHAVSSRPWRSRVSIELRTELPGPRSREILERKERVVADPLSRLPARRDRRGPRRDAHRRRRQHVHRLHRRRRLPERRPLAPACRRGRAGAARALRHTDFTIVPYEIYVTLAERLIAARAVLGPSEGGVLQRRHRGGRERDQVRARRTPKRPAVIGFEGGFHGRTLLVAHADVEDAPVQGGPRPVRARGLPRPVRAATTAGRARRTALDGARARARDAGRRRERWRRS